MDINRIADQFGTPAYIYDLSEIERAHAALKSNLPVGSRIYYSLKANPHPAIVAKLASLGCFMEISSIGECKIALEAGRMPSNCLYTGPAKTVKDIEYAMNCGVIHYSVESCYDFKKINQVAQNLDIKVNVILRINPLSPNHGYGLAMSGVSSQFGIDENEIDMSITSLKSNMWIKIVGIHVYTGSNINSSEMLRQTFRYIIELTSRLSQILNFDVELIDLGGGFGHPYASKGSRNDLTDIGASLEECLSEHFPSWRTGRPIIAFESGRYLVAAAGTLITKVEDLKVSKGEAYAIVDSGIHHLGGMTGLGRLPKMAASVQTQNLDGERTRYHVAGSLCTPLDFFARGIELNKLNIGDILSIPNVGAYGLTASLLGFLSREMPLEIIIEKDNVVQVSQLELNRNERRPSEWITN